MKLSFCVLCLASCAPCQRQVSANAHPLIFNHTCGKIGPFKRAPLFDDGLEPIPAMSLALLPLLALASFFATLRVFRPSAERRADVLRAAILAAVYASLATELLSLFSAIDRVALIIAWLFPAVALAAAAYFRHLLSRSSKSDRPRSNMEPWVAIYIAASLIVVCATGVVAFTAPTNTWDSLTYHMSRVAHWTQNQSVRSYATGIDWQNGMGPGSEFLVLQSYVLAQGDRLANLVQWLAMVFSLVGVSLIAARLGGGPRVQAAAALFAATLPMGIIQASSTMTDYVVTLWVVCVASETLEVVRRPYAGEALLYLSLAASLAILAKPTSLPFLLPFGLVVAYTLIRGAGVVVLIRRSLVLGILILFINGPQFARNQALFNYPFGVPQLAEIHLNNMLTWKGFVSNLLRHSSLHAGTPWDSANDLIYRGIVKVHLLMGIDPNDPRTTSIGPWQILKPTTREGTAGNSLHAYLYLAAFIGTLLAYHRSIRPLVGYSITVLLGFLLFAFLFKFQLPSSRYHLPFFVLFSPVAGLFWLEILKPRVGRLVPLLAFALSYPWLLSVDSRPLVPLPQMARYPSVLAAPRERLLFGYAKESDAIAYTEMAISIAETRCGNVGLMLDDDSLEYSLWALLGAPRSGVRIEWMAASPASERLLNPSFKPCAVVCQRCSGQHPALEGMHLTYDHPPFRLYLAK